MNREIKFRAWFEPEQEMNYMNNETHISTFLGKYVSTNSKLMQYTGLKDKNGKEIYEGDIVKHYDGRLRNNTPFVIKFEEIWLNEYGETIFGWNLYSNNVHNYIIIGNIYENPELLEENK